MWGSFHWLKYRVADKKYTVLEKSGIEVSPAAPKKASEAWVG